MIGLETMPRTMDNIGFYSRLGFHSRPAHDHDDARRRVRRNAGAFAQPAVAVARVPTRSAECRALIERLLPGYDYTREIELTAELALGDTVLLYERDRLVGFALAHTAPLVEGRVARGAARAQARLSTTRRASSISFVRVTDYARRSGTRRVAVRMQGEYAAAYQRIIALGGHVRWTDLRMSFAGREERPPTSGLVLSNWEI